MGNNFQNKIHLTDGNLLPNNLNEIVYLGMEKGIEDKFELNIYDQVLMNVSTICNKANAEFPDQVAARKFRLYLPKYIVDFINISWKEYALNGSAFGRGKFTEGLSNFMNFPIYYNHSDEIVIAVIDIRYSKEKNPCIKMTKFTTTHPIFDYGENL